MCENTVCDKDSIRCYLQGSFHLVEGKLLIVLPRLMCTEDVQTQFAQDTHGRLQKMNSGTRNIGLKCMRRREKEKKNTQKNLFSGSYVSKHSVLGHLALSVL